MTFSSPLPPESTDPWYSGLTAAWSSLTAFVNGLLPKKMAAVTLDADTEYLNYVTVADDGSSSATWPDRLRVYFDPQTGDTRTTFWLNEYGEIRGMPGRDNTVAARWFRDVATAKVHTGNLVEVQDNRTNRNVLFAIDSDGKVVAPNVQHLTRCYPTGSEPSPTGVVGPELWVEYTP